MSKQNLRERVEELENRIDFIQYDDDSLFENYDQKKSWMELKEVNSTPNYPFDRKTIQSVEYGDGGGCLFVLEAEKERFLQIVSLLDYEHPKIKKFDFNQIDKGKYIVEIKIW